MKELEAAVAKPLVLGDIRGAFGVRGWVRIRSFCRPQEDIFRYDRWWIRATSDGAWTERTVIQWQPDGEGFSARLRGIDSREDALALRGHEIAVPRAAAVATAEDRYLWADLIGLNVETLTSVPLGEVVGLIETGAADVLEIRDQASGRHRLIPFVPGHFVQEVDLTAGRLRVDWHPDD